jgi:hypothetical protein
MRNNAVIDPPTYAHGISYDVLRPSTFTYLYIFTLFIRLMTPSIILSCEES